MNNQKQMTKEDLEDEVRSLRAVNSILTSTIINSSRRVSELEQILQDPLSEISNQIDRMRSYQNLKVRALNSIIQGLKSQNESTLCSNPPGNEDFKAISTEYWKHVHQTEDNPGSCWRPEIDYVTGFLSWFFGNSSQPMIDADPDSMDAFMLKVRQDASERQIKGLDRALELLNDALLAKCKSEEQYVIEIVRLTKAIKLTQDPEWYWKERPTHDKPYGTLKTWAQIKEELGTALRGDK